jgi:CDP-glycerol glycerophosphotransferase
VTTGLSRGRGRGPQRPVRLVLQAALRLLPRRRHVVVYGWGDDEGNAIEVLRHLSQEYDGHVYWLVDSAPAASLLDRLAPLSGRPPGLVARMTPRALSLFLTAEAVFHTHGLFTSPHPGRRKVHVNLWHGDGPKRMDDVKVSDAGTSSFVVSGTRFWGREKARFFGVPESCLLVTGNPRIDQFDRPASDDVMVALGLDPGRPLVLWMPTFRTATLNGESLWTDSPLLLGDERVRGVLDDFSKMTAETGAQFVVKPHPLDADAFDRLGVTVLRSQDLAAQRCGLYQLLGRCSALVTDYSSVWTDFLALDRPVLLFCPDLERYEAGRAFTVDHLQDVAPGHVAQSVDGLVEFLSEVAAGRDTSAEQRRLCAERLGAVVTTGATARLFTALCATGRLCVDHPHRSSSLTATAG